MQTLIHAMKSCNDYGADHKFNRILFVWLARLPHVYSLVLARGSVILRQEHGSGRSIS